MNSKFDYDKIIETVENLGMFDCVKVLDVVGSTNDYLKESYNDFDRGVVFAKRQTNGRGRLGRTWLSEYGGCLMFSMLIKPEISDDIVAFVTQLTASVIHKTLVKYTGSGYGIKIKWPNDIMLRDKKICGILTERIVMRGEKSSIIIGIGLNLYESITDETLVDIASTIEKETGVFVNSSEFIKDFFLEFFRALENFTFKNTISSDIISYINENFYLMDKVVTTNDVTGVCGGIDESGHLVVDGKKIISGIVESVSEY